MTKIEEMLDEFFEYDETGDFEIITREGIESAMKEYAEVYTKKHCENLFERMGHWSKCSVEELRKLILETSLSEHE